MDKINNHLALCFCTHCFVPHLYGDLHKLQHCFSCQCQARLKMLARYPNRYCVFGLSEAFDPKIRNLTLLLLRSIQCKWWIYSSSDGQLHQNRRTPWKEPMRGLEVFIWLGFLSYYYFRSLGWCHQWDRHGYFWINSGAVWRMLDLSERVKSLALTCDGYSILYKLSGVIICWL